MAATQKRYLNAPFGIIMSIFAGRNE